jgi:hypothetical protein
MSAEVSENNYEFMNIETGLNYIPILDNSAMILDAHPEYTRNAMTMRKPLSHRSTTPHSYIAEVYLITHFHFILFFQTKSNS